MVEKISAMHYINKCPPLVKESGADTGFCVRGGI